MIEEIRCNLLRTRRNYKRSNEINELISSLDSTYSKKILNLECELVELEENIYNLLHKKIRLDARLESFIRRNMTFTQEFSEADYDYVSTCKKLDNSIEKYIEILNKLDIVIAELVTIEVAS